MRITRRRNNSSATAAGAVETEFQRVTYVMIGGRVVKKP